MSKNKNENKALVKTSSAGIIKVVNSLRLTDKIIQEYDNRILQSSFLTVKIGNQEWMSKNLDFDYYVNGDPIPQVQNPKEWEVLKTGAWCYHNNEPRNGLKYGKLYNWYAIKDSRGLAPNGFKIPCKKDFTELCSFLDSEFDLHKIKTINEIKKEFMGGDRSWNGMFSETIDKGGYWSSDSDKFGTTAFYIFDEALWMVLDGYANNLGFRIWCIKEST